MGGLLRARTRRLFFMLGLDKTARAARREVISPYGIRVYGYLLD